MKVYFSILFLSTLWLLAAPVQSAPPSADDFLPPVQASTPEQQQQLSQQLNSLCRDLQMVKNGLTIAGRFLCIGGKQIKPQLQQDIESTLKQMQPSLDFVGDTNSEK